MIDKLLNQIKRLWVRDHTNHSIHRTYHSYERAQRVTFMSHESSVSKWKEGQIRFIDKWLADLPRDAAILDVGCGDGVGLEYLNRLGFENVTGIDFQPEKLAKASKIGFRVILQDFHHLNAFREEEFDVVYSSHSLEHALYPSQVLSEFSRVCREGGLLILVLPYPDTGTWNDDAHCAKYEIGTNIDDGGRTVIDYVEKRGFRIMEKQFDNFREPEIWMKFQVLRT